MFIEFIENWLIGCFDMDTNIKIHMGSINDTKFIQMYENLQLSFHFHLLSGCFAMSSSSEKKEDNAIILKKISLDQN